ncbi:unnamed protein product, partial [Closterium sp. NIES-53]
PCAAESQGPSASAPGAAGGGGAGAGGAGSGSGRGRVGGAGGDADSAGVREGVPVAQEQGRCSQQAGPLPAPHWPRAPL